MQTGKIQTKFRKSPNTPVFSGPYYETMYNFRSNEKRFLTTRDVKSNNGRVTKDLSFNS